MAIEKAALLEKVQKAAIIAKRVADAARSVSRAREGGEEADIIVASPAPAPSNLGR